MLSTFIKLPFVIKIFVLSVFEWLLKTGFTVHMRNEYLIEIVPLSVFYFHYIVHRLI